MPDEQNDIKLISRKNSGFPEWLDFEKLRREGIDHIGKLSGKIWTDHNVHDPGITSLEILCYALLDLGYRTNLPAKDIFARNPDDKKPDDNFLTPAEILTVNPLTITDYRKLLIDIPGIKNAWLEVATDINANTFCTQTPPGTLASAQPECCIEYLNGLYHVYLDTEKNLEEEFPAGKEDDKNKYLKCLVEKVKKALMIHRNICEDFADVKILCKWKIGVCAEIELEDDADPEKVYLEMIEKLRQFFSPSPRFYTLQQMLDNKKTIDQVFAGRPYDIRESHGFVDTDELEKLDLRKSIHVSDVYSVLFAVPGIRKVLRLRLINCKNSNSPHAEWNVKIPEEHVPDFNITCSGFEFTRRGINVSFDFKKYEALLKINFEHNGKILYKLPSDKLDAEIPKGTYHKDLGTYYSIQNEFPRVYGIAEGGLPASATIQRKAQALQFKGYLLFFDQLLANYLSQLQNIRSLFPIRLPGKKEEEKNSTYFSAVPGSVPEFQQLVRYKTDEAGSDPSGDTGFLAFPVSRLYIQDLIDQEKLDSAKIEELPYYRFSTAAEKNIAIGLLQEDMLNDLLQIEYVKKKDDCVYYYATFSSYDFVLVSRKYYKDEKAAAVAAASVKYAGTIRSNYRTALLGNNAGYSFTVELNISGYAGFLQQLTENETLYHQRRQGFLDHLLARFAEKFTDFALLSYSFYSPDKLQARDIEAKKSFLSHYALLSSSRGKAFDYTADGWYTDNNSGFEKKVRGLLGHDELKRKTLCNFDVYDYTVKYVFSFQLTSSISLKSDEKFITPGEARSAALALFDALSRRNSYRAELLPYQDAHTILVNYGYKKEATFNIQFDTPEHAEKGINHFFKMLAMPQANGKVDVFGYRHLASVKNADGTVVRTFADSYPTAAQSKSNALKSLHKINASKTWGIAEKKIGKLASNPSDPDLGKFIDEEHFKPDINNTIIGKPDKYNFSFLDKDNHFMFNAVEEFDHDKTARERCMEAIHLLSDKNNLSVEPVKDTDQWGIYIRNNREIVALCAKTTPTDTAAEQLKEELWGMIRPAVYSLTTDPVPDTWKFYYTLGYEPAGTVLINSAQVYHSQPEAESALVDFSNSLDHSYLERSGNNWTVVAENGTGVSRIALGELAEVNEEEVQYANQWLTLQREVSQRKILRQDEQAFANYISVNEDSPCRYVYHLVDKDGRYGVSSNSYGTLQQAITARTAAINKDLKDYDLLELLMYGNIREDKNPGSFTWYHYQVRSSRPILSPVTGQMEKIILFESITGYLSKEDAEKAFAKKYMEILTLARDSNNYGEGKPISETKILIHEEDGCSMTDSVVYIPEETLRFLGLYPQQAVTELISIVNSYPVRSIKKEEEQTDFKKLFSPCEINVCEEEKVTPDCRAKKEEPVYYFALFDKKNKKEAWIGTTYYESAEEAMKAFRFFYSLLRYEGNYFISCDCAGSYRIYVREVLAESRNRYMEEKWAWGAEGVEKFILVSQKPYSFHAYTDEDCCYRFFVACKNTRVVHPCKYDSQEIRDRMIRQLQYFLPDILPWKFNYCNQPWDNDIIDFEEKIVGRMTIKEGVWVTTDRLNGYLDLYALINNYSLSIIEKDGVVRLNNCNGLVIDFSLIPGAPVQTLDELKEKLLWLACYFPFVKRERESKLPSYCIEIRIPGFNMCENCDEGEQEPCPAAWINECCAETCESLLTAYTQVLGWISNFNFYKPVFDCPCGPYGIELYDDTPECIDPQQQTIPSSQLAKIIAVSPQCYPSAAMVCEAIERAKRLINSEGLHLVEHILLRPHCLADCACILQPCPPQTSGTYDQCEFPYWDDKDDEDPCDTTKPVCFKPGHDPYSFIATVALPAWPERFRKKENRILLENMLYREAPAHVALRILWLTPHDLCCFEKHFKNWLSWIAYKKVCDDQYSTCQLINYLFHREFECWEDTEPCDTCNPGPLAEDSCVKKLKDLENQLTVAAQPSCPHQSWFDQLSELYCWKGKNCSSNFYVPCDSSTATQTTGGGVLALAHTTHTNTTSAEQPTEAQFVNTRRTSRKKIVEQLAASTNAGELSRKIDRYLGAGTPSATGFNKLVDEFVKNVAALTPPEKAEQTELIARLVHFYADKTVFAADEPDYSKVQSSFEKLGNSGVNLGEIYSRWEPLAVKKYISQAKFEQVKKLFGV